MLSDRDHGILDFEEQHPRSSGMKADRIREHFAISAAVYYQRLNRIIDDPVALSERPMLVKRLLRLRRHRMATRVGRVT